MPRQKKEIAEENQKPLFFNSLNALELPVNNRLPAVNLVKKEYNLKTKKHTLKFRVPAQPGLINIFLFVNNIKKDMLYQVKPGSYSFTFSVTEPENLVGLCYICGGSRSPSNTFIL